MQSENCIRLNKDNNVFRFEKNKGGTLYVLNVKNHYIFECNNFICKILNIIDGKILNDNLIKLVISQTNNITSTEVMHLLNDLKREGILKW